MKQYQILKSRGQHTMEKKVNEAILQGWVLQGGISLIREVSGNGLVWFQAMVKDA